MGNFPVLAKSHDLHRPVIEPDQRLAPLLPARFAGPRGRRVRVDRKAFQQDIGAALHDVIEGLPADEPPGGRAVERSGAFAVGDFFGIFQKLDHISGPRLIHFLVKIDQLALEMGVAVKMFAVFKSPSGSEAVADELAVEAGDESGAPPTSSGCSTTWSGAAVCRRVSPG